MSIQEKKFLDKIGISYLWNLIKSTFVSHDELDTVIDAVESTINDTEQSLNDKIDSIDTIQDVKVNGTSVVTDRVAEIPRADKGVYGYTTASGSYGTQILNHTGEIRTVKATNAQIDTRTHDYNQIVPTNLDYAVKAALTDGKGTAYTDAQKQSARERIGAVGTDDLASAGFDTDSDGNIIITGNMVGDVDVPGLDVQINGESIVQDGVANIQYGSSSVCGVVKYSVSNGIEILNNGLISLKNINATNGIKVRRKRGAANDYCAVTSENIVYAVKSVVTTTTESEQLTEEEQAKAQAWLGIYPMSEEGY